MQSINRITHIFVGVLALGFMGNTQAQGVSIGNPFVDFTTWSMYSDATVINDTPGNGFTYSILHLTHPGVGSEAGAAFAPTPIALDYNQAFTFDFSFFTPPGSGPNGDGMTFVLTPDDPSVVNGGSPMNVNGGSDLGYGGSGLSGFAFAIDTFHFSGEPVSPSIQILQDGDAGAPLAFTETSLSSIYDPGYFQWSAILDYTPSGNDDETGTLTGTITQFVGSLSFSVSTTVDWSSYSGVPVYYGFTAGSGLADDGHYVSSAMAVPEPETYAMLLVGLGLVGWRLRRSRL